MLWKERKVFLMASSCHLTICFNLFCFISENNLSFSSLDSDRWSKYLIIYVAWVGEDDQRNEQFHKMELPILYSKLTKRNRRMYTFWDEVPNSFYFDAVERSNSNINNRKIFSEYTYCLHLSVNPHILHIWCGWHFTIPLRWCLFLVAPHHCVP